MINNMNVSIITPIYNVENYIERCARSLFEQTMDEGVEFIFVNDCTPDRSVQVLEEVASEYPNRLKQIRFIHHSQNGGAAKARNSGLAVAQGVYIFYADGDDWAEKDMLKEMYEAAKKNDADIVRCDFFYTYKTVEKIVKQSKGTDSIECVKLLLSEKLHGALWTKLVKRSLYRDYNIGFSDGNWQDLRTSVQLFYYAKKIIYIPKAYYHYVQYNPNSVSGKRLATRIDEMIIQTDGIIEFLKDNNVYLDKYIHYLKLACKQNLLFTCKINSFRKWLQIYPESNPYIWSYPSLPLHLRIVGGFTALRLWPLINLWILLKRIFSKHPRVK